MSTVTASIDIAAPLGRGVEDGHGPPRLGDWVTIHRGLRHVDDGTATVGFKMDQRIHLRGVSLDVHWRLAECRRTHARYGRGAARLARALAPNTRLRALADGGTRFDYANDFHAPLGPIGALASRALVGGMPEREATRTLERLRALLESANCVWRLLGGCRPALSDVV